MGIHSVYMTWPARIFFPKLVFPDVGSLLRTHFKSFDTAFLLTLHILKYEYPFFRRGSFNGRMCITAIVIIFKLLLPYYLPVLYRYDYMNIRLLFGAVITPK